MSIILTIQEFKEETIRARKAYLSIINVWLESINKMSPDVRELRRHSMIANLAWNELNALIEWDAENSPIIENDQLNGTNEWFYYCYPSIAVDIERIINIFDYFKTIEGFYNLEQYYENFVLGIDLPDKEDPTSSAGSNEGNPYLYGDGFITRDILVAGVGVVGGYSDGMKILKGTHPTVFVETLMRKAEHPTYIMPTISIDQHIPSIVEVGTYYGDWDDLTESYFLFIISLSQNDAGAFSYVRHYINDKLGYYILEKTEAFGVLFYDWLQIEYDMFFNAENYQVKYKAQADYATGPIKRNNLGEDDPYGRIIEGTIETEHVMTAKYYAHIFLTTSTPGTWVGNYNYHLKQFLTSNTNTIEGSFNQKESDNIHNLNVMVPPGWAINKDLSWVRFGEQGVGINQFVFKDDHPYKALLSFDVLCGAPIPSEDYYGMAVLYSGISATTIAPFPSEKVYFKLVIYKI